jgi:hypothetical protein
MIGGTLIHASVRTGPGPEESSQANLFPLSFGCGVQIERMHDSLIDSSNGNGSLRSRLEFGRNRVPAKLTCSYGETFTPERALPEDQMRDLFAEDSNN